MMPMARLPVLLPLCPLQAIGEKRVCIRQAPHSRSEDIPALGWSPWASWLHDGPSMQGLYRVHVPNPNTPDGPLVSTVQLCLWKEASCVADTAILYHVNF